MTYIYVCTPNGHQITDLKPVERCLGFVHGKPCKGELIRIGAGSRKSKVTVK